MRNFSILFLLLIQISISSKALAVGVQSIYTAEVLIASQSEDDRKLVEKSALEQVLIKVSGNSHILQNSKIQTNLSHSGNLVEEYSYSSSSANKAFPYILAVRFDPLVINRILQEAGSPIWGQTRPLILVWLAYDTPGQTAEIIDNSDRLISPALNAAASQRGIPFIFPMMDMTELNEVTVNDILTKKIPTLQQAAQRYQSNGILIGHLSQTQTGINSDWQLILVPDQWNWKIEGKTFQDVSTALVNNIVDTLSERYSSEAVNSVSQVILRVNGIKGQVDLVQLMQYLQRLTPVADVQLRSVNGSEVILDVSLRGSKDSFIQTLALNRNLEPISGGSAQDQSLQYQWKP